MSMDYLFILSLLWSLIFVCAVAFWLSVKPARRRGKRSAFTRLGDAWHYWNAGMPLRAAIDRAWRVL